MSDRFDLLFTHALLVDPGQGGLQGVLDDAAIATRGGRIAAVGPTEEVLSRGASRSTVDASGMIILPGLINAHTHASATLFRGYAPDVAGRSFFDRMWRIEALLSDEDVYVGALAGCLEMIRSGTTCFANHFSHMDQVARAVQQAGIRAGLSRTMIDRGDEGAADEEIARGLGFADRWAGRCDRITPMLGPHSAYTCSDRLLARAADHARRLGLTLHLHIAESPYEREVMERRTGRTTVQHLDRLAFFDGNRILGAHSLLLDDGDMERLQGRDFHSAVCATGKMNRGQGIADLSRLLEAGINVCLGTDGSASDNLDLLMGMKVTHISQNYLHGRPCALPPETVLAMATSNGARALGLRSGPLVPGRPADFILIDSRRAHLRPLITSPRSNIVFNIVYHACGADVDTVVVDGKVVMDGGVVRTLDEEEILGRLQRHAQRLWDRAGPRSLDAGQ